MGDYGGVDPAAAGPFSASSADTLTNKTIDADGTGNALSNIDVANCIAASSAEGIAGTDNTKILTSLIVATAINQGGFSKAGTVVGVDTITAVLTPAIASYGVGLKFWFIAAGANTGAVTVNLNSVGALALKKNGGSALVAGDIVGAGAIVECAYDGTDLELVNAGPFSASSADTLTNKTVDADGTGNVITNIDIGNCIAASQAEAEAGTDNTKLLTSLRTAQAIAALAVGSVTASSTDTFTNKTIDANGTGNSITNIDVADLAAGTDGELITWDASGNPAVVAVGTAGQVLTSGGAGVAPTFAGSSIDLSSPGPIGDTSANTVKGSSLETEGHVQFPATQVPSANANALDEYEEGTFTPALNLGGAAVGMTYTEQLGTYTRIGRMVQYQVKIVLSAKGSSTGSASVVGWPFSANAGTGEQTAYIHCVTAITFPAGHTVLSGNLQATNMYLRSYGTGSAQASIDHTSFTATAHFAMQGTFYI